MGERSRRPDVHVVELKGADVRRFANGMFTNNVRDLPVGHHQHSAMTDDRGRLKGLMDLVAVSDEHLFLVLEGMDADTFEATYGMFIVFDDVELSVPEGEVWTVYGVDDVQERHWDNPRGDGVDVWVPDGRLPEWMETLEIRDDRSVEAARIERCWPRFPVDASDKQLPHELGLRDTHLHFEKGCYRGQEIIHRVDVMGQVRKGLVGLVLDGPVEVGTTLTSSGKKVGRMGSSILHDELGRIGLAVVRKSHHEIGTVLEAEGVRVVVRGRPQARP